MTAQQAIDASTRSRVRLSGRRVSALLRHGSDSAGKQTPGTGARLHQLSVAAGGGGAIAQEMRTATANAAARALLPESDRDNPALYPAPEVLARGEWFEAMPPAAQRLRDRLWTQIKSA